MKRHLNTIFVTTQGSYLAKEGETVVIKVDQETKLAIPIHTIGGIVCFGQVSCSPFLMGFCAENDVGVSFLTENGRFLARVQGYTSGNVLLRRQQYRLADDDTECRKVTRSILTAKFANARHVLQRAVRDHGDKINTEELRRASHRITQSLNKLENDFSADELRGLEGDTAHSYFSGFDHLIVNQKESFVFKERNRRPPLDNVNCLLSFLYTLLFCDVRSALETVGLDSAVGFFHRDRPGRASLALDLMEEFRPVLVDRLVLSLINLGQVQANGFKKTETGAVLMNDETRKKVIVAYQERKQDEIMHPFIDEKITVGRLFFIQALLLARYLRGDIDGYPAFIWR